MRGHFGLIGIGFDRKGMAGRGRVTVCGGWRRGVDMLGERTRMTTQKEYYACFGWLSLSEGIGFRAWTLSVVTCK